MITRASMLIYRQGYNFARDIKNFHEKSISLGNGELLSEKLTDLNIRFNIFLTYLRQTNSDKEQNDQYYS